MKALRSWLLSTFPLVSFFASNPGISQDFWEETNIPHYHRGADIYALAINSTGHIFAGTDIGVFRSTDNGGNWTQINSCLWDTDVRSLAINSSGHIFAGTKGGRVYRSTNNGGNWTQINTGLTNTWVRLSCHQFKRADICWDLWWWCLSLN